MALTSRPNCHSCGCSTIACPQHGSAIRRKQTPAWLSYFPSTRLIQLAACTEIILKIVFFETRCGRMLACVLSMDEISDRSSSLQVCASSQAFTLLLAGTRVSHSFRDSRMPRSAAQSSVCLGEIRSPAFDTPFLFRSSSYYIHGAVGLVGDGKPIAALGSYPASYMYSTSCLFWYRIIYLVCFTPPPRRA